MKDYVGNYEKIHDENIIVETGSDSAHRLAARLRAELLGQSEDDEILLGQIEFLEGKLSRAEGVRVSGSLATIYVPGYAGTSIVFNGVHLGRHNLGWEEQG